MPRPLRRRRTVPAVVKRLATLGGPLVDPRHPAAIPLTGERSWERPLAQLRMVTDRYRTSLLTGLVPLWCLLTVGVWALAFWLSLTISGDPLAAGRPITAVTLLANYDGIHFTQLARQGYSVIGDEQRRLAFFPLLPALARLVGGEANAPLAGVILSQLALLGSVGLLNRLAPAAAGQPWYRQPGFWLLVNPLSLFFLVFYSEALSLFLMLAVLVALRRDRPGVAIVAGLLAGLTRPTIIIFPLIVAWETWQRYRAGRPWRLMALVAVAPWLTMVAYLVAVAVMVGRPFAYFEIQQTFWSHQRTLPFVPLLRDLWRVTRDLLTTAPVGLGDLTRPMICLAVIGLLVWGWRHLEPGLRLYSAGMLLMIFSLSLSHSAARYTLLIFPIYLLLPTTLLSRQTVAVPVAAGMLLLQALLLIDFLSGRWVG